MFIHNIYIPMNVYTRAHVCNHMQATMHITCKGKHIPVLHMYEFRVKLKRLIGCPQTSNSMECRQQKLQITPSSHTSPSSHHSWSLATFFEAHAPSVLSSSIHLTLAFISLSPHCRTHSSPLSLLSLSLSSLSSHLSLLSLSLSSLSLPPLLSLLSLSLWSQ